MSKKESKIPQNLWNEFENISRKLNKKIDLETTMIEQGKTCDLCIWGTNVDGKKIFCPFPKCVMVDKKAG